MNTSYEPARDAGVPLSGHEPGLPRTAISASNADRRRTGLRQFLARQNIMPSDLARMIGLPSPNSFYNLLSGRSASLATDTVERIVRSFPGESFEQLLGWPPTQSFPVEPSGNQVLITYEACAGLWRRRADLLPVSRVVVPVPEDMPHPGANGFGVRVRPPGAEVAYRSGSILICRPLDADPDLPPNGTRLIVRRERDRMVEVTVREAIMFDGFAWLWLRSTDPSLQRPIKVHLPLIGVIPTEDHDSIVVLGRVVAAWCPEGDAASD
jgi:hypothetical protein